MRGTIKWYHAGKHLGFLVLDQDNREIFIHINDCEGFTPETGMIVEFELGLDRMGRPKAIRIKRVVCERAAGA